jgi:polysaccharide biosynthesis transport protein
MELRQIYALLRRWAWLLILGLILGAAAGYFFSNRQKPIYRASTKILVIYASQKTTNNYAAQNVQDLASTYVQLLTTRPILDTISQRVGHPVEAINLQAQIISSSNIVQIYVKDSDPQRAALIANTSVDVLVKQNEAFQSSRYTQLEESIQTQINQVETQSADLQKQIDQSSTINLQDQIKQAGDQISSLQNEISTLQAEIGQLRQNLTTSILPAPTLTVEDQKLVNEKQSRLAQLEPLLTKYQDIYSNLIVLGQPNNTGNGNVLSQMQKTLDLYQQMRLQLLGDLESVRLARLQNTSTAQQIEPATVPNSPISPKKANNTLLAGVAGLVIMGMIVFLLEYLDDTIKSPRDVKKAMGLPVLGYIAEINYNGKKDPGLHVAQQPRSPVAEAFRTLRTNLEFAGVNSNIKTILISSTDADEGKTTVAVNLAAMMAMGGKRVLLVDADMRKPKVHRFLGLNNRNGLSDILRDGAGPQSAWQEISSVDKLNVITSGHLPANPTELLGSEKMDDFLESLKNTFDIIIIDSPPFVVADAQVMSAKVDGVLLIVKPGFTRAGLASSLLEQLRESEVKVLGVVFNNIPRNFSYDYGWYHYYYSYKRGYPYDTKDNMAFHKDVSEGSSKTVDKESD